MKKLLTGLTLLTTIAFFGQNDYPATGDITLKNNQSTFLNIEGTGTGNYAGGYIYLKASSIDPANKHVSTLISTNRGLDGIGSFTIQRRGANDVFNGSLATYKDAEGWKFNVANTITSGVVTAFKIAADGNVGIGTTSPDTKLHVKLTNGEGDAPTIPGNIATFQTNQGASYHGSINIISGTSGRSSFYFGHKDNGSIGGLRYNNSNNSLSFRTNNNDNQMLIASDGNVGIGTTNPSEKLTVNGKILCEEVEVILDVPAADYVFEKYYNGYSNLKADYVMPTLEEVEDFTKTNNHLPDVPSAKTLEEDGLQLKDMSLILLQKIEELTLYTIEQEKRIKALEAELKK